MARVIETTIEKDHVVDIYIIDEGTLVGVVVDPIGGVFKTLCKLTETTPVVNQAEQFRDFIAKLYIA